MKKIIFLIFFILLFSVGCTNVNNENIESLINKKIQTNYNNKIYNIHHPGYQYYLPKKMSVKVINESNEIITSEDYNYYLYVDLIRVLEGTNINFENDEELFKYYKFEYKEHKGYLKIKEIEEDYLVEIMYNYAKIEVMVDKKDLNEAVNNSIIVLSTIDYDLDIIKYLMEDGLLNFKDESLNLFDKVANEDNFIKYEEEYDDYETDIPDYDVIK